jgi:cytoplasmic iron level regulating protein YaaA (DUF328/UPF0246 family)
MKIIISPAKSISYQDLKSNIQPSTGVFLDEAEKLAEKLQKFSTKNIGEMLNVNTNIAELNYERFQKWERPEQLTEDVKPAISLFTGEVYRGLDAKSMDDKCMQNTQEKLRILSGMYGLMKPMDLMFPYRLEMGTRWVLTPKTKNLYIYWGSKIADFLNAEMEVGEELINLASSEYFKAIDRKVLKAKMITPVFQELKNGEYKVVMTYAKNARGRMSRYILEKNLQSAEEIKGFDWDSYGFDATRSSDTEWIFTR